MIRPDRAPRTASVRGVVVFGLAVVLLLLLAGGIFYRYFAHRWWYDAVVRTTPSMAHLYELYRLQGFMSFGLRPPVFDRIRDNSALCERFQQELLRRYLRLEDPEVDGWAIVRAVLYLNENRNHSVREMRRLWIALMDGCQSPISERRTAAGMILNALSTSKAIEDPSPGLWLAYSVMCNQPVQVASPSRFGEHLADALAESVVNRTDSRVMEWAITLPDESGNHTFLVQFLCSRIKANPKPDDIPAVMEAAENNPSAMGQLLCAAVAERPDCAGLCLDASIREPRLAAAVWSGLSRQSSPTVADAIAQRWDRLEPMLAADFGERTACSVIKTLLALGDRSYMPWIRVQAIHGRGIRGHDAIQALAERGEPADADLLMPRLFDPDTRRIAGWSIRRLDGARIQSVLIEALWTDPDPLTRLEAISAVSEDDPFTAILSDLQLKRLDRNAPLYQALLIIGLTLDQKQLLESVIGGSDR